MDKRHTCLTLEALLVVRRTTTNNRSLTLPEDVAEVYLVGR